MNTKAIIAINAAWAAVAAGAFFIGKSAQGEGSEAFSGSGGQSKSGAGDPSAVSTLSDGALADRSRDGGSTATDAVPLDADNAERRIASALADIDPLRRKSRMAEMLLNLTPETVPGVLAAFENAPKSDETSGHFRDFLYAWGRIAGKDAIAYMMDPESKRRDHYGGTSAVAGWAAVDAEGAKNYVASVENQHGKEWLHYGVFREVMRTDLDDAIAYSEQNGKSRARGRQMDMLTGAILEQRGVGGLTDWVATIDHTAEGNDLLSYKQYAASVMLDKLAGSDSDAALQWITDNAGQPYLTSDGLERAARRAGGPINEELDWLADLPDGLDGQRHAIGERFEDYIREDFAAAGKWLAGQELGPTYDEAIQDYAMSAAKDDREAALAWAQRITDPKLREETVNRVAPRTEVKTIFFESGQGGIIRQETVPVQ